MNSWLKVSKEMLGFILFSFLIGASAQMVLPKGISLKTEVLIVQTDSTETSIPAVNINPNSDEESASIISLPDAYLKFQNQSALFIDARDSEAFLEGHIRGAINIPAHAFMDSIDFLENMDPDSTLITYCDGADCNASIDLAADLKMMGFSEVYFFFGGWKEWVDAQYPLERLLDE